MADNWKEWTFSSGVTVLYGPFPQNAYWDIMARALELHPDPEPPQKEIEVLGGTEMMDDEDDPAYQAALQAARVGRYDHLAGAVLDLCVELKDPAGMEAGIARAERWTKDPAPDDPDDRKRWFLSKFAIRTPEDWGIVRAVQRFSQVEDEEVAAQAEFFPGDVEGDEGAGADAPGAAGD